MSGTGKSTLIAELAARGHRAVDLDCDEFSEWAGVEPGHDSAPGSSVLPDRDWIWREDRVRDLLARDEGEALFVSGCAANMTVFLPRFDDVVLLHAPADVIVERLAGRTGGEYGARSAEVSRVRELIESVEPMLRRIATHELDTSGCLEDVVAAVLKLASEDRRPEL